MTVATAKDLQMAESAINLFDVGCLINLHVGTWSGRKMVTRQDLVKAGLDPDKLPRGIVNYGRKLLVPKSELQAITNIAQRARVYLEQWSIPFCNHIAHFVPMNMLATLEAQMQDYQKDFFELVDSFILRFGEMKEKMQSEYPDFWEKSLKEYYPPNPKALRDRFKFQWHAFKVAGVNNLEDVNTVDLIAQQNVVNERTGELRSKMQDEVSSFVEEYVSTMRLETVKFCDMMNARISGKPYGDEEDARTLTARSLNFFRKHVDKFRKFNVFGDNEIEKLLKDFSEQYLGGEMSPKDFDDTNVKNSVTNALKSIREKAADHGSETSNFIGSLRRTVVL